MMLFKAALSWVTGNITRLLVIALIILSIVLWWLWKNNKALKIDMSRVSENFIQKDKQVSRLNLTVDEFEDLQTKAKFRIDSLLKAIKEKPKNIIQVTDIDIQYRDTGSVKTIYKEPIIQPDESFIIPVSVSSDCWGMKGQILSKHSGSRFNVTERISSNNCQVLIIKRKHFLWWTIRPETIKAFTNCGELQVTQINFKK